MCCRSLNVVLTEKRLCRNAVWMWQNWIILSVPEMSVLLCRAGRRHPCLCFSYGMLRKGLLHLSLRFLVLWWGIGHDVEGCARKVKFFTVPFFLDLTLTYFHLNSSWEHLCVSDLHIVFVETFVEFPLLSEWCSNIHSLFFFSLQNSGMSSLISPTLTSGDSPWSPWTMTCMSQVSLKHRNFRSKRKTRHDKQFSAVLLWGMQNVVRQSALVCLTGGSRGSNTNTWSTTETWKYITREGRWVTVAPMLRPRTNHTSATLNGEIYVIGGKKINTVLHVVH